MTKRGRLYQISFLVILVGACSSHSASPPPSVANGNYVLPVGNDVPPEQREWFADGEIALTEYNSAFNRFFDCAKDGGGGINEIGRDELTGVISYTSPASADLLGPGQENGSVENGCYQEFFVQTEIAFQQTDPIVLGGLPAQQMQLFNTGDRLCLDYLGIPVPADLEFLDENWMPLVERVMVAIKDGSCPQSLFD